MNDPTQHELLSAYLDGELTADEQAEVELLLADDPSARQLLDELRALSVALQDLPQETVGEDLSEAVLRAAARRVLLDGPPGESSGSMRVVSDRPSIARRFFNVRGLTYAGLAATFALLLLFVDLDKHEPTETKPLARATPKTDARAANATIEKPAEEQPDPMLGYLPPEQAVRESIVGSARVRPGENARASKAKRFAPAPMPMFDSAKGAAPPEAKKQAPPRDEVLVVHCDVTPAALADNSFEKLLVANGIVSNRRLDLSELNSAPASLAETPEAAGDGLSAGGEAEPGAPLPLAENEVNLIYVEATPEQIAAMLRALTAEPKTFSNVAMSPPPKPPVKRLAMARSMATQDGAATDEGRREKSAHRGGGMGTFGAPPPEASNALEHDADEKEKLDDASRPQSDADNQGEKKEEAKIPAKQEKETPRRRVLFVLRNISADHPAAEPPAEEKEQ